MFGTHRIELKSSVALLALVLAGPAVAQEAQPQGGERMPSAQTQTQGQQQDLSAALDRLQSASQKVSNVNPSQQLQVYTQAKDALNSVQNALDGMKAKLDKQRGAEALKRARNSIATAEQALNAQQSPQKASDALKQVVTDVRNVQNMAQADASGPAGDKQAAAADEADSAATGAAPRTEVEVREKQAQIQVQPGAPDIGVVQPAPKVTIDQPAPQVTITQPKPDVTVKQAEPQVNVETAKPDVTVEQQGKPEVSIDTAERAQVELQRPGEKTAAETGDRDAARDRDLDRDSAATGATDPSAGVGTGTTGAVTAVNPLAGMGRELVDRDVYGAQGNEVGEIEDVVMGADNKVTAVLVDVGGFLGIGERRVAIPIDQLRIEGDRVISQLTEEQVNNMPEYRETDR